jgi:hypothetical protein
VCWKAKAVLEIGVEQEIAGTDTLIESAANILDNDSTKQSQWHIHWSKHLKIETRKIL